MSAPSMFYTNVKWKEYEETKKKKNWLSLISIKNCFRDKELEKKKSSYILKQKYLWFPFFLFFFFLSMCMGLNWCVCVCAKLWGFFVSVASMGLLAQSLCLLLHTNPLRTLHIQLHTSTYWNIMELDFLL